MERNSFSVKYVFIKSSNYFIKSAGKNKLKQVLGSLSLSFLANQAFLSLSLSVVVAFHFGQNSYVADRSFAADDESFQQSAIVINFALSFIMKSLLYFCPLSRKVVKPIRFPFLSFPFLTPFVVMFSWAFLWFHNSN